MTRKTIYTEEVIENILSSKNYALISFNINSVDSYHLIRHECGGMMLRTSKQIIKLSNENDSGCIFQPCSLKGKLTLRMVENFAKQYALSIEIPSLSKIKIQIDNIENESNTEQKKALIHALSNDLKTGGNDALSAYLLHLIDTPDSHDKNFKNRMISFESELISSFIIKASEAFLVSDANITEQQKKTWTQLRRKADKNYHPISKIRKKAVAPLTENDILHVLDTHNMTLIDVVPKNRNQKMKIRFNECGHESSYTFKQLSEQAQIMCTHADCNKYEQQATDSFIAMLKAHNKTFISASDCGLLQCDDNSKRIDRDQIIQFKCDSCSEVMSNKYVNIKNLGYTYCTNTACEHSEPSTEKYDNADDYVSFFKREGFTSFVEVRKKFPSLATYLKAQRCTNSDNQYVSGEMYRQVREKTGWTANTTVSDYTEQQICDEISDVVNTLRQNDESLVLNKSKVLNNCSQALRNYLKRINDNNIHSFVNDTLEINNVSIQSTHRVYNITDVLNIIDTHDIKTWSDLVNRYPTLAAKIKEKNLKAALFQEKEWNELSSFADQSNEALLTLSCDLFEAGDMTSMHEFEKQQSALTKNLRQREIINQLYERLDMTKLQSWTELDKAQLLEHVKQQKFMSLAHWHQECSGSYKQAARLDVRNSIASEMEWSDNIAADSKCYDSLPECLAASVLFYISQRNPDFNYQSHVSIDAFRGPREGVMSTDFVINNNIFIEVWAYDAEHVPSDSDYLKNYTSTRAYKEANYSNHNMSLVSIEATQYNKNNLQRYIKHICTQLENNGLFTFDNTTIDDLVFFIEEFTHASNNKAA